MMGCRINPACLHLLRWLFRTLLGVLRELSACMSSRSNLRIHGVKKVHRRPLSTKTVLGLKLPSHKSSKLLGKNLHTCPWDLGRVGMGWANLQSTIGTLLSEFWSPNF